MTHCVGRSLAQIESGVAAALREDAADEQESAAAVAEVIARDLNESAATGTAFLSAVSALAYGATHAAVHAHGTTSRVATGFIIGVMLVGAHRERRLLAVIEHAAGTFVKHVIEAHGDVAAAARGLVMGAVSWAGESGVDATAAAAAAGQGAVDAAEDVGRSSGVKVRESLGRGPIAGVVVPLKVRAEPAQR